MMSTPGMSGASYGGAGPFKSKIPLG